MLYRVDNNRCRCSTWKEYFTRSFSELLTASLVSDGHQVHSPREEGAWGILSIHLLSDSLQLVMQPVLTPALWALLDLGIIIWGCFLLHVWLSTTYKCSMQALLSEACDIQPAHVCYVMCRLLFWVVERKGCLKNMNSPLSHLPAGSGNVGTMLQVDTGSSELRRQGSFYTWHKFPCKEVKQLLGKLVQMLVHWNPVGKSCMALAVR